MSGADTATNGSGRATVCPLWLAVVAGLVAAAGLISVISAGFALSFDAIRAVACASGIRSDWAWLLPAVVDGARSVGTIAAVVLRRLGNSAVYPWVVVLVNSGISVGCNVMHAGLTAMLALPRPLIMAVSAIPALNLAMSVHLLVSLVEAFAGTLNPSSGEASGCGDESSQVAPSLGSDLQRRAWEWASAQCAREGRYPSGAELGLAFERSSRWGRQVLQAGRKGAFQLTESRQ